MICFYICNFVRVVAINYLCCHFTLIIRLVFLQAEIGKIVSPFHQDLQKRSEVRQMIGYISKKSLTNLLNHYLYIAVATYKTRKL